MRLRPIRSDNSPKGAAVSEQIRLYISQRIGSQLTPTPRLRARSTMNMSLGLPKVKTAKTTMSHL